MKSLIKDAYANRVASTFKNKANVMKLMKVISSYLDRNTENLSTIGPVKKIVFLNNTDRDPIFQLVGITAAEIQATAKQAPELSRSVNASDPFNILMVLIIRYFRMAKQDQIRKSCCLYLLLSMYPSLFTKYFKFTPNENIMAFTISSMSNKYKIKQQGTLLSALIDLVNVCDEHYADDVIRLADKDLAGYISAVKTRLNSFLKNICGEFMKQHKAGNYINYQEDNMDPDNFTVADSNSLLVERLSQAVVLSISVNGPDMKAITLAAKMCVVSTNDMRSCITALCKDKKNKEDIRKVVSSILYDFLFNETNRQDDIRSTKFTVYALNTYKKSNTNNTNIVSIKEILDKWLAQYSERYRKTNTMSTLNCFRRAMYMFWVFTIQRTKI